MNVVGAIRSLPARLTWLTIVSLIVVIISFFRFTASLEEGKLLGLVPKTRLETAGVNPRANPLDCAQIARIGRWSLKRHAKSSQLRLTSRAFGTRLATNYVEKLDPHRVLFTHKEVQTFVKRGRKTWLRVLLKNNCRFFEVWTEKSFRKAKAKLKARLAHLSLSSAPVGTVNEEIVTEFETYAKNEKELQSRLNTIAREVLGFTRAELLAAFENDRHKIVADFLDLTSLNEPKVVPRILTKAMLATFDPHSTYFTDSEFKDFYADLSGGTLGLGIQVKKVPAGLIIEKVIKKSPAGRSRKLRVGDIIKKINQVELRQLSPHKAKQLLRGDEDDPLVRLSVLRVRRKYQQQYSVILKKAPIDFEDARVSYRTLKFKRNRVAVIEIPSFYGRGGFTSLKNENSASEDVEDILAKLLGKKRPLSAIVLDLRGNPGGYLEEAVSIAGLFVGNRPVVGVIEEDTKRILRNPHTKAMYDGPLVVLVDEESASAAEVLAGALKDYNRALLVGSDVTYGKGSIQRLFRLNKPLPLFLVNGKPVTGTLKLTTSYFYSPLGFSPAGKGITTHISLWTKDKNLLSDKKSTTAPKISPLLRKKELKKIRARRVTFQKTLTILKKKNRARLQNETRKKENHTFALKAAVELATDYAHLSHKYNNLHKSTSQQSPLFIRGARRGIIMEY